MSTSPSVGSEKAVHPVGLPVYPAQDLQDGEPERELSALAAVDDHRPAAGMGRRAHLPSPGEPSPRLRTELLRLRHHRVVDHLDRAASSRRNPDGEGRVRGWIYDPCNVTLLTLALAGAATTRAAPTMQTMRRTSLRTRAEVSRAREQALRRPRAAPRGGPDSASTRISREFGEASRL